MVRSRSSSAAAASAPPIDLDAILDELDERWQYRTYSWSLLAAVLMLASVPLLSYIFTAGQLNHRCRVPQCDVAESSDGLGSAEFQPSWLTNAVPRRSDDPAAFSACERFAYVGGSCDNRSAFDQSLIERCPAFVYETPERTIGREVRVFMPGELCKTENVPCSVCLCNPHPPPSSTSPAPMTQTSGWRSSARSTMLPAACCCRYARPPPIATADGPFCSPIWR